MQLNGGRMDGRKTTSTWIPVYTTIDSFRNAHRRSINSLREVSDQSLTFGVPTSPAAPGITV